jgi:hypothetical protein
MRGVVRGLLVTVIASGCASIPMTPEGRGVSVFTAPLDGPAAGRAMPDGCRKLAIVIPKNWMSEQEMEGQSDPFRKQRHATGAGGGNAVLVLKRLTAARSDFECPNAVPIRDCAPSSGAWYDVEFESYECTADALRTLNSPIKK